MLFFMAGALGILNALFLALFLPETNSQPKATHTFTLTKGVRNIRSAIADREPRRIYLTSFLYLFGFTLPEDFAANLPQIPRIFLYHSRDDDVVPFAHLALYAEKLPQATVRELDGRGHLFNAGFPELVDDIKSL